MNQSEKGQNASVTKLEQQLPARHLDLSVKHARDIVLQMDQAGTLLECNDAALAAYGWPRQIILACVRPS